MMPLYISDTQKPQKSVALSKINQVVLSVHHIHTSKIQRVYNTYISSPQRGAHHANFIMVIAIVTTTSIQVS